MSDIDAKDLKKHIEAEHGGTATLVQSVAVDEKFPSRPVWLGTVHIFDLIGLWRTHS